MSGVSLSYWISLCFAFAAIGASPVWGRTITVDDDQPADYAAIQPAIQAAVNGDTILVRDGTYKGPQNRALDFAGKAITLQSENGPANCIIDCESAARAFYFHSGETAASRLEGLTIRNGYNSSHGPAIYCAASPTIVHCTIENSQAGTFGYGGGIYIEIGSPTIDHCLIRNNHAEHGGGIFCNAASPKILDCLITGNSVTASGGGIHVWKNSNPTIQRCRIADNQCSNYGGGILFDAASMTSQGTVLDCEFSNNQAVYGGGIAFIANGQVSLSRCIIRGNMSTTGGGIYATGAGARPTLTSCLIVVNYASGEGGGLRSNMAYPNLVNCTFAGNVADSGSGAFRSDSYAPTLSNCILWGNTPTANVGPATITHSDVQGGYAGTGNINSDPLFGNALYGEYHLLAGSPCFNAGNNAATGIPAQDMDGKSRILGGTVDLGAYESGPRILHVPQQYSNIQEAIDAAAAGDTVLVADGVYVGSVFFRGKSITVRSANGPQDCIIDGSWTSGMIVYMNNLDSSTVLQGFTIRGCTESYNAFDSPIYCSQTSSVIRDCIIRDNTSRSGPSAILCQYGGTPSIINCTIMGNVGYAPAILCRNTAARITNCTIVDNVAYSGEGVTGSVGGGIASINCSPVITNTILWGNSTQIIVYGSPAPSVTYSNVQGGYSGTGNLNLDPQFADAVNGDYRLTENSGCRNQGNNAANLLSADQDGQPRQRDGQIDLGAFEYTKILRVPQDYLEIQLAIDAAGNGHVIQVSDGIYSGNLNFNGKRITLRSEHGPQNCIIQGTRNGPAVVFESAETYLTSLEGVTITGGSVNGSGGGILCDNEASPRIENCIIKGNQAQYGGGVACLNSASPVIVNCLVYGNIADQAGGGILCDSSSTVTLTHGTVVNNTSNTPESSGGIHFAPGGRGIITNSILRGNEPEQIRNDGSVYNVSVSYNNIEGGCATWMGFGNIDYDALFIDPAAGDYHLQVDSPCIGTARADGYGLPITDLEGRNRYTNGATDMGTYEYGHDTWNVPSQIGTIQEAIDKACYGDTIIVDPGTYPGGLDFKGKAITLQAKPGVEECMIDCDGTSPGAAFYRGERATSVLSGFTIVNANGTDGGAIFCMNSAPTIVNCVLRNNTAQRGAGIFAQNANPAVTNCTIAANTASVAGGGLFSSGSPSPIVTNCILWGNTTHQVIFEGDAPLITYSNIQGGYSGIGNINSNPRFVNSTANDYHLTNAQTLSMNWTTYQWYLAPVSPCVDKGTVTPVGMPVIDKDNLPRIYRASADMGAYEVQGSSITYPPQDWGATIDMAVSLALDGDTIWVADGSHRGGIDFRGKAIAVRSVNGPAGCILTGGGERGVIFRTGEGPASVLSGFTIQGYGGSWNQSPGGISCVGASPTIEHCVIQNNGYYGYGGGIFCGSESCPTIQDCQIIGNVRSGIFSENSSPTIRHCMIVGNDSSGIVAQGSGRPIVINCLIRGNTGSNNLGGGVSVGGWSIDYGSITLINCTLTGNYTANRGGGMNCWNGSITAVNTLIWGNVAMYNPDEHHWSGGPYYFVNCHIGGADPKFRNPPGGDYRLLESSPCFNAGTHSLDWWMPPLVLPETDLAGNPRILYGIVDVGAYELEYRPVVSGQLKIDITPEQAAQEGAQWQLGDGIWHNSGEIVSGLTAGDYSISFKSLSGWIEPTTLPVWVSGDHLAMATAEYKSTHFTLGQIPALKIRQGQELDFQVRADGLPGTVTYSYQIQGSPQGPLSLDPATGRFVYVPSAQDRETFSVTLIATNEQRAVFQTMEITPIVDLPEEYDLFDEPTQPLPDPQSDDYIIKEVFDNPAELFNNVNRTTRTINILGKDIVIQSGNPNNLYLYDNNEDIKAMTIYADNLIVRSPFRLPQTSVTIFARQIHFEGQTSCIDTTPRNYSGPAPNVDLDPAHPEKANGSPGSKGGSVTLHVESLVSEGNLGGRFISRGGHGQEPGMGKNGADGISIARSLIASDCAYWIAWPPLLQIVNGEAGMATVCTAPGFPGFAAMSGKNATASGKPGRPGDGGNIYANFDPTIFVLNGGGLAQPSTPAALHNKFDKKGGAAGQPFPAYFSICYPSSNAWDPEIHHAPGQDASAPEPDLWAGNPGQFHRIGHSLSWLHPHVVKMVVGYAKDAYLNKYYGQAKTILESYLTPLNQYISSTMYSSVPDDQKQELEQLRDEILSYIHQLECGLDFFGNPPGWAPMLSFEVTQQVYEREVDRALQVLYLSYWMETIMGNAAQEAAGLETARNTLKQQIDDFKAQYTAAVNLIPVMKTESQEIAARVSSLQQQLQQKEQELLARAEQNIKDRHKVPWWKKAMRVAGSLLTTVPRATSPEAAIVMGAGTLASSITEEFMSDESWPTIINQSEISKQFSGLNFDDAVNNWMTDNGEIIAGKSEAELEGYLNNLRNASTQIASNMTQIKDTLKETHINNEEVEAELIQIKEADPEFDNLIDDTVELMTRKELFGQKLASAMQQVSSLSNGIRQNLISIDAMNRRVGEVAVIMDQRARLYMKEMERRARNRLLKYHYYLSKAYEYRLLEPYPEQLNLLPIFDRFETIVSSNGQLSSADFQALRPLLTDQLSSIADDILERFLASRGGGELGTSFTFNLTADEIQQLNTQGKTAINLYERGLFLPSEEDIRIVNLGVESLTPQNPQAECGVSYIKIYLEHSGISRLMKNGQTYLFRHYRKDSSEDPSINKSAWGSTYDHNNHGFINPISPSFASESLLRSVLGITDDKLMIYSRPSAWSDLNVRIEKNTGSCDDILIASLKFRVTYDYSTRNTSQVVVAVDTSQPDLTPYFMIDTPDLNSRKDGQGAFCRTYQKSTYGGKKVSILAPEFVDGWQFLKWTRRNGLDLPSGFYTADPMQIQVPLDASYSVRAQYHYVGGLVRCGDGDADQDVDMADLGIISAYWMQHTDPGCSECDKVDFNNDGQIDLDDLMIFVFHWLQ